MKRRFEETLLAVAIAALGVAASAMAPTIGNIKSPVIGNEGVSEANSFVYPDAFSVDGLASDPDGTVANDDIIWSYTGVTDRYQINGIDQIEVGTDNPVSPGSKQIDTQDSDPSQVDNDSNTLTFRDATIDPIGGPQDFPTASGIVAQDLVTLFASDGTTYSMKSFWVYTDNGGEDRLSGSAAVTEYDQDWTQTSPITEGWTTTITVGTPTLSTAGGMCIDAGAPANDVWGTWISPTGIFDVTSNSVYRIRMVITGEGQAAGTTPLWTVVLDNNNNTGTGDNKWGAEWLYLDNENGANSPGQGNRSEFLMYWNPLPISDAQWNDETTGMFTPGRVSGGNNDARLQFRVLDINGPVPGGNLDGGQICMTELTIDRIDYSDLAVGTEVFNEPIVTQANFSMTPPNGLLGTSTSNWSGAGVTVSPTDGNWELEIDILDMGDANVNLADPATLVDNFPITWLDDELIKTTITARAPNATAETNPVDVIRMQNDTPTNEILMYNLVVSTSNTLGMPRQNEDVEYVSYFYSHNTTQSSSPGLDRIRSRVAIINSTVINSGGTANNAGNITLRSMKVEKVVDPTL